MSATADALPHANRSSGPGRPLPPELASLLRRAGRRLRLDRSLFGLFLGLATGLGVALAFALLARVRPLVLPEEAVRWCLAVIAVGGALGTVAGLAWPAPRRLIAVRADRVLGLRERVSTALELSEAPGGLDLATAQIRDAAAAASAVARLPRLGPAIGHRLLLAVAGLTIALTLALWLPNPQRDEVRERRADADQVEAAREEVEAVAAQVAARTDLDPALQDAMLARLAALSDALEPGAIDGADAQAELAAAEGDLRRLEDGAAPTQAQALREAAPILQTSGATADVGNALAGGDLAAAAEAMEALGERADDLAPEEQQALANRLNELAAQVQATNSELAAALAAAASSLQSGDPAAAAASLSQAGAALSEVGAAIAGNEAASAASSALATTRTGLAAGNLDGNQSTGAGQSGDGAAASGTPGTGLSGSSGASGAQSATPGAGQSGSGQSGSGQSGGQGQGAGSGGGASGQVAGSNARTSAGATGGDGQPQQGETGTEGNRDEEPIYAPATTSGQIGAEEFISGQEGPGNSETGAQTGAGVATDATVPYSSVYGEYAQQASRDLDQGAVPAPLQPYVRDYFSALDPAAGDDPEEDETP